MLIGGETSYHFDSHLQSFCAQNKGLPSDGMVNLQVKKPTFSLGTAHESSMMGEAGRWLNRQLKGSKPLQILQAYPVPSVDFLNYVFPEEHRVKIHGRTDFVIGVKIIIDQMLRDERKSQLGRC